MTDCTQCDKPHHCPECRRENIHSSFDRPQALGSHRSYDHGVTRQPRAREKVRLMDRGERELLRKRVAGYVDRWSLEFQCTPATIVEEVLRLCEARLEPPKPNPVDYASIPVTGSRVLLPPTPRRR